MKIALCLICKPTAEEAKLLDRCLKYASPYVDGIFVTQAGERKNPAVSKVIKKYEGEESFYKWDFSFANARNFNFQQVPKDFDYILWLDADDVLRGGAKIKPTLEENPNVDTFSFWYLYTFDEYKSPVVVHHKTRIVKNDGCVEWAGALHEDFKELRTINPFHVEGIEVLHLSNDERFDAAKSRNVEVAEKDIEVNPDDPRSYWNLGNSLAGAGKPTEALAAFDTFLEKSKSDDEKYIVRLRRAEAYLMLGEEHRALSEAQAAIGMKPHFPDAYYAAGSVYLRTERYREAADMFLMGLQKPKPYHQIIVYNPRDYDYNPMMDLARCYLQLSRPDLALPLLEGCLQVRPDEALKETVKEMRVQADRLEKALAVVKQVVETKDKKKIAKILAELDDDIASHPAVCRIRNEYFVKEKSSGKDLVYFCGFTEEEWTPQTAKEKGIGGSEEAVIHLTKRWADAGWNVTVYNNCGHTEKTFDGVTFKPFWMWNPRDRQDVTILWRAPRFADYEINSEKIYIDMHDVVQPGEFNDKRLGNVDKIFVKSQFHRSLFPHVPDEKFVVVPNGIDPDKFEDGTRDPMLVINTSSPDRSLSSFITVAEMVKKEVPTAKFQWAYGWGVYDIVHKDNPLMMAWKQQQIERMEKVGVENLGRINHDEIAKKYCSANVFLYPTEFAEIDCISISKAMAGGAIPVTTDFAALGEKQGHGGFFFPSAKTKDDWDGGVDYGYTGDLQGMAQKVVELLFNPPIERSAMRQWAKETYSWKIIAETWLSAFGTN